MHRVTRLRSVAILAAGIAMSVGSSACMATVQPRAGVVYVRTAPPRRIVEVRSISPGRNYIWIDGYHQWRGNAYAWVPGRWEAPAANYRQYQKGEWKHDRNGWYWVEGHWR
ncbi:MAG: hypothetical protein ABJC26_00140 [Gemmatimonadaceae bacterium]